MIWNKDAHHCKHCQRNWLINPPIGEADVFLICPGCGWRHYRHFEAGIAVHCDINKATGKIREVNERHDSL